MADAPPHSYVNLLSGLTRTTREKAMAAARGLLAQAGLEDAASDAGGRVVKLAEEIMNASRANRELLQNLVTAEVERAAARLGFARADEVAALRDEVAALRARMAVHEHAAAARPARSPRAATTPEAGRTRPGGASTSARKAPARKAPAKTAPAKTAPAEKAAAGKRSATRAPARKSAGRPDGSGEPS